MEPQQQEETTVYCGNLAAEVTEELLYELFLQVAPLRKVHIPMEKTGKRASYGFVTFKHSISVPYAISMLHNTPMFDRAINVRQRNNQQQQRNNSPASPDVNRFMNQPLIVQPLNVGYNNRYEDNRPQRRWNPEPFDRSEPKHYKQHDTRHGYGRNNRNTNNRYDQNDDHYNNYNNRRRRY